MFLRGKKKISTRHLAIVDLPTLTARSNALRSSRDRSYTNGTSFRLCHLRTSSSSSREDSAERASHQTSRLLAITAIRPYIFYPITKLSQLQRRRYIGHLEPRERSRESLRRESVSLIGPGILFNLSRVRGRLQVAVSQVEPPLA